VTSGPDRVHLVVERTDGSRIIRLPAPRWLVSVGVGLVGLLLVAAGALYSDYVTLKAQRAEFATFQARLAEQRATIDGFHERVAEMRAEVDGWHELHARIWQPFGPEGPAARGTGVGGGTAARRIENPAAPPSVLDDLTRLGQVVAEEGESLRALERFMARAGSMLAALPSRWPLRGPVNSDFGKRISPWSDGDAREASTSSCGRAKPGCPHEETREASTSSCGRAKPGCPHMVDAEFHSGLDIGAPRGSTVTAPAPGTVVFAGSHAEYGVTLIIDHGHDIKTLYGHLSRVLVSADQKVQRGQAVALSGNTGRSSGPHLHYEIQVAGQAVNPRSYLWD
jgi:murein DD-endopeptidase MepM/ murein hydrolase activator NlpD